MWKQWLTWAGWTPSAEVIQSWVGRMDRPLSTLCVIQGPYAHLFGDNEGRLLMTESPSQPCDVVIGRLLVSPYRRASLERGAQTLVQWRRWVRPGGLVIAVTNKSLWVRTKMSALFLQTPLHNPTQTVARFCMATAGEVS